eukprot:16293-Heterococcus_DN1.PRE.1
MQQDVQRAGATLSGAAMIDIPDASVALCTVSVPLTRPQYHKFLDRYYELYTSRFECLVVSISDSTALTSAICALYRDGLAAASTAAKAAWLFTTMTCAHRSTATNCKLQC